MVYGFKLKETRTKALVEKGFVQQQSKQNVPKLNIVILIVGTRGDVQPFVSLGQELSKDGHNVRLGTHEVFRSFVRDAGLGFYPIGGDPSELIAYMVKNPGLTPSMESVRAGDIGRKRKMIKEILAGCWNACTLPEDDDSSQTPFDADAIISNPVSFAHIHCAERLNIPLHIFFTMPWSKTKAFAHPLSNMNSQEGSLQNELSYYIVETLTWNGLADLINGFRKNVLSLNEIPVSSMAGASLVSSLEIPHTYCWSPSLIPKPTDWGSHIDVCGFFFLDLAKSYQPPSDLQSFLAAGPPPVYIGFGSIVVENQEKLVETILDGLRDVPNVRAIISKGWGQLSSSSKPDNVYFIGDCPHDWLFQNVAAVVCHGGAGTTAAALRCGKPVFVVPFFGDQKFWGEMVARAGAGPSPVPHKKLTSKAFAAGVQVCLRPETQLAAQKMSKGILEENGLRQGVESFYNHLPLDSIRCDLDASHKAEVFLSKKGVKVCRACVDRLVEAKEVSKTSARKAPTWKSKGYRIVDLCASSNVFTGLLRGASQTTTRSLEGVSDLFVIPAKKKSISSVFVGMGSCVVKIVDSFFIIWHEGSVGAWNTCTAIDPSRSPKGFEPQSFSDGMKDGVKYVFIGLGEGCWDLVAMPVQGLSRRGIVGLGQGFIGGIVSAMSKPVGGAALMITLPERGLRAQIRNKVKTRVVFPKCTK